MNGLDHTIEFDCGEGIFHVWTPDCTGAVLGSGKTEREAKENAIRNMESLCAELMGASMPTRMQR